MEVGNILLFPDDQGQAQAAAYAQRYFRFVERAGVPMFVWKSSDDLGAAVSTSVMPRPPVLDRTSILGAISQAARSILENKETVFLQAMQRTFPTLGDEQVQSEKVSVTSDLWHTVPSNALVYERTTTAGSLVVVSTLMRVDISSGEILYAPPVRVDATPILQASAVLLGASQGMDTLKSVLNLIQMVAFGFGPEGIGVAAGIGTFELMFLDSQKSQVDLPKEINDLVVQDLANDHVKQDLAKIVGYTEWFADQNQKAMAGEMPEKDQATYADACSELKQYVVAACDPGSALRLTISDLCNGTYTSDPPFSVLGFPAFLLGASMHLAFEKCRILFSTDGTSFRSPITYDLVNAAKDYLGYAKSVVKQIEDTFKDRLNGVGTVTQGDCLKIISSSTRNMSVPQHYIYFADSKASTWPSKPILSGDEFTSGLAPNVVWYRICPAKNCASAGTCDAGDIGAADSARARYISDVTVQLQTKFNYSDDRRKDIAASLADLQSVIDLYLAAAPKQ